MITDPTLKAIVESTDQSIVIEIYSPDAVPGASGFDPAGAIKCYASTGNITFAGRAYTRIIKSLGKTIRTTTDTANTLQVTLDNLTREASEFEFATGFQGCIIVERLISRSLSTDYTKSIILFAGRCDKPTTGTREQLPITAKSILSSIDVTVPRRKYTPVDQDGRVQGDPLFEGFLYMPQYFTSTYSTRERKGGILGLLGFKKTVMHTLQYSSYSDLDADKYVPLCFGRVQIAATHIAYADVGTSINITDAVCEGPIEDFANWRTDDLQFTILTSSPNPGTQDPGGYVKMWGELGGKAGDAGVPYTARTGRQQGNYVTPTHIGNAFYSRTAVFFTAVGGSSVTTVDAPPNLIFVVLASRVIIPDTSGVWNQANKWSDNPAAVARWLLTSPDWFKLDPNWIDDAEAYQSYKFNDETIFDSSNSDVLFIPVTGGLEKADGPTATDFTPSGDSATGRYLQSTGLVQGDYFEYLAGNKTPWEAFIKTPNTYPYDPATGIPQEPPIPDSGGGSLRMADGPVVPPDPDPGGGGTASLTYYLRRRYTCNVVVTESMKLLDFMQKVIFMSARMYLTQGPSGKLRIKNKKPAANALATGAVSGTSVNVDNAAPWVVDLRGVVVIDPNTPNSEVRKVLSAIYPTAQNSTTLSATSNIGVTAFSGATGGSVAAFGKLTINTVYPSGTLPSSFTLDGITVSFQPGTSDTTSNMAGFIYATINAHPTLSRKYVATWTTATNVVTITAKWGTLTLDTALTQPHAAGIADPSVVPVPTAASGGSLQAGSYRVGYVFRNQRGQTLMSTIVQITVTANQKINVAAISPPVGAVVDWYCSPAANSPRLRRVTSNNGAAISILTPPLLTATLPPEVNRTGAEVLRLEAVFTDRAEPLSAATRSNVLKASFAWKLGNREKGYNRIDIKFRDSTQDFRLVELRIRDDANIAKTKVVSNLEVNGQAIDNYNQAYRIGAGLLAEFRDADFFYSWDSDRDAILLEEGDVVAITDDGSEVINLPVRIESIEYTSDRGFLKASFTGRIYSTQLYDDSVADRMIPIIIQP